MRLNFRFAAVFLLLTVSPAAADYTEEVGTSAVSSVVASVDFEGKLKGNMSGVDNLKFSFRQDVFAAGSTQTVKARVYFSRPESIRIEYSEPQEQVIVFSGGELYTYIPAIRQATKHRRSGIPDILGAAASVILSEDPLGKLREDFDISVQKSGGLYVLSGLPSRDLNYDLIEIEFPADTMLPSRTSVTARHLVSVTEFRDYIINPGIDESIFRFTPPRGTNIIELE